MNQTELLRTMDEQLRWQRKKRLDEKRNQALGGVGFHTV